jgi:hypothetical protein
MKHVMLIIVIAMSFPGIARAQAQDGGGECTLRPVYACEYVATGCQGAALQVVGHRCIE